MNSLKRTTYRLGSSLRKFRASLGYPINEKLFQFCGLQRSGNHAVINWIISQKPLKTCFINGIFPQQNPWYKNWGLFYRNFEYWPSDRDKSGALVAKELLLCSYENRSLEEIFKNQDYLNSHVGKSQDLYSLLILRDPYNTFASWLKADWEITPEIIELWKSYAREFLGETQYLPDRKVIINFNHWFLDREYRHQLARKLDLQFTDNGLNTITHHGGGSSFDKQSLDGKARNLKVLERFQNFIHDPTYLEIFKDRELHELSTEIFGEIAGTETISR
ncbi:hypothetical protein [Baaleninema simplex]|uniref:hypothetical protein n=1 Tax=Baaleninema simplex TaxID=2862350 RepID=UPI00034493AA|nr:hypothetical protein [Baaleninema simplex]